MYRYSKYNIVGKNNEGNYYIFNALYKHCDLISKEVYEIVKDNEIISLLDKQNGCFNKLYEKGYLVDENKDEEELVSYHYETNCYKADVIDLTIILTHACNFNCTYCYQCGETKSFTKEAAEKVYRYLEKRTKRGGIRAVYINWFGGEPLIESQIMLYLSNKVLELAHSRHFSYIGRIISNGYLLNKDLFSEMIKAHILFYTITIDGIKEIHDRQRPLKNGEGTWEHIINNLTEIRNVNRNFSIDVRVNVSNEFLENADRFLEVYKEKFDLDSRYSLVFEGIHDWRGERIKDHREQVISSMEVISELYSKTVKYGIHNIRNYLKYNFEVQICPASKKNGFCIDGNGDVFKCEMAINDPVYALESKIGFINEEGEMEVDIEKEAKWLIRTKNIKMCYDCVAYPYCMGGGQCNYGLKFHKQLRCEDNIEYLKWSSQLLSLESEFLC